MDHIVSSIARAIANQQGVPLGQQLAHSHILSQAATNGSWNPNAVSFQAVSRVLSHELSNHPAAGDWVDFVSNYLVAFTPTKKPPPYDALLASLTPFLKIFREDEGDWLVEPMRSVVHTLYYIAGRADAEERGRGKKGTKLVDCGDQLRKFFSVSLQAPNNPGKKLAALDIVNVSFKIYFRLNTLRLCKNLIRTVESRQFQSFESVRRRPTLSWLSSLSDACGLGTLRPSRSTSHALRRSFFPFPRPQFPTSQKVTYKFYEGRLAVFDENYEEAQEALTYALTHCHASAKKNIALILKYLIPVGLLLGRLPSGSLAREYGAVLGPYLPIAESLRSGNVGAFYSVMQDQRNRLVKDGTYLLLEKLQASVYRRLLKQVYFVHAQAEPAKAAQIPLVLYERALKIAGVNLDMSEIECIIANLIVRKYVKGYISHKLKVLVVHKTQPFPGLDSVVLVD